MSRFNAEFWAEVWSKYPETEIVYGTPKGKARLEFYSQLLPMKEGLLLDLGCGDGVMSQFVKNYVGLDVSRTALKRIDRDVVLASGEVLPFRDCIFEHVIMVEVYEHIVERARLLGEVRRVLKVNGELIMSCPYGHHPSHKSSSLPLAGYGLGETDYVNGRFDEDYFLNLMPKFNFQISKIRVTFIENIPNNIYIFSQVVK